MKLSKRQSKLWQYMIRQLKEHFQPGVPVEVKTVPASRLKGLAANCDATIKLGRMVKIAIRINNKTSWTVRYDSLMHEWAHAMEWSACWTDDSPKKEHGETWGVWYAKIYQHIVDHCWADMKERGLVRKEQMHIEG